MGVDYKYYDFQLHEYLIHIKDEINELRWNALAEEWYLQIQEEIERIKTKKFRVAVVGEFKRGKTSFINALLGKRLLPEDIEPATAVINRIIYGDIPKAYLIFKDGTKQQVAISTLKNYVTKLTKESQENAEKIQEAVVEYPSILCQNYVELIDTPGMNDDYKMNQITIDYLERVDLAIVAVSAMNLFSETEADFVARLVENPEISQIVVVVTYIDRIRKRERDRVLNYLKNRICEMVLEVLKKKHGERDDVFCKYENIFQDLHIYGVSSPDALEAREQNNQELFVESGFEYLNKELPRIILCSQNNCSILKGIEVIEGIGKKYQEKEPSFYENLLSQESNIEQLEERILKVQQSQARVFLEKKYSAIYNEIIYVLQQKNIIKQEFIQCLSDSSDLRSEEVEQKLKSQMISSFKRMRKLLDEEVYPFIEFRLKQEWEVEKLCLFRELDQILCNLNGFQKTKEMIRTVLEKLEYKYPRREAFGWLVSLVPSQKQIMEKNIMDPIMKAVECSLNDFCLREQKAVEQWMNEEKQKMIQIVEEIRNSIREEKEREQIKIQKIKTSIDWQKKQKQLVELRLNAKKLKEQFLREVREEKDDLSKL